MNRAIDAFRLRKFVSSAVSANIFELIWWRHNTEKHPYYWSFEKRIHQWIPFTNGKTCGTLMVTLSGTLQKTCADGTVFPKKYAHGFCFAVLCCGYTLTDLPISIRLTSLALWQSNDCPSASKATLLNMDKYFMWIHYERLHNHEKAKHNKTVCIFLEIYCMKGDSKLG